VLTRPQPIVACLVVALAALAAGGCATLPLRAPLPDVVVGTPAFARTMEAYAGARIEPDNAARILQNGEQLFPAVLTDIRRARHTITYAQYFWDAGAIGSTLSDALAERCRAGVSVSILLDAFGALAMPDAHRQRLEAAGCRVVMFHPLSHVTELNHRNHQRILVVDGTVGFTGGWGVGRRWTGNGRQPDHWRETDVRLEGRIVSQLQAEFVRAWADATGAVLGGAAFFPPLARGGGAAMQVIASDPEHGDTSVYTTLLLAIASARRSILITTPYFVPDARVFDALCAAAQRHVRVQLLLAGPIDWNIVRAAGRHTYGRLLTAGIEIYEYTAARLHAKTLVIDDRWASIGSANVDMRSLGLNRELNVAAYDAGVAGELTRIFETDLRLARRLDVATWRQRPVWRRLFEILALPLRGVL